MAVIAELEVDASSFDLGRVTTLVDGVHVELERVVPTGNGVMPFFWAGAPDQDRFERVVRDSDLVDGLDSVSRVDDRVLYEVVWRRRDTKFTRILEYSSATILQAAGSDRWSFELRFSTHDDLQAFHDSCRDEGVDFQVDRVYTLGGDDDAAHDLGLTPDQREALVVAVEAGYYQVPRRVTLDEVAAELSISQQAASERVRRGTDAVLSTVLFDDPDDGP